MAEWVGCHSVEELMSPMLSEWVPMKYLTLNWLSIGAAGQRRRVLLLAEWIEHHSNEGLMSLIPSEWVPMKYLA